MPKKRLIPALAAGWQFLTAAAQVTNDAPGVDGGSGRRRGHAPDGCALSGGGAQAGRAGSRVVELKLDANGSVADARIVSGPDELRNVTLQSVLQWHLMKNLAGSSRQVSIFVPLAGGFGRGYKRRDRGASAGVLGGMIASSPTPGRAARST